MPTPSPSLIKRARGLVYRTRTVASAATQTEEPDTRRLVLRALRHAPASDLVPLTEARVAVAASPALATGLAREWTQATLSPLTWREELTGAALLVVEVAGGQVAGWPTGSSTPAALAARARESGIPCAAWVTDDDGSPESLVGLRGAFDAVLEGAPAAQVRAQSPATVPATGRVGDVLVRHDKGDDHDKDDAQDDDHDHDQPGRPSPTGGTLGPALRPTRDPLGPPVATVSPVGVMMETLERGGLVVHEWELPDERITPPRAALSAQYSVLLDVGVRAPGDVSPLLDAISTRTAVVTTPDRAAHLPTALQEHVAAVDPVNLRRQTAALAGQPELRDRMVHLAHRTLLDGHTVTDRARQLLEVAGAAPSPAPRTVSVLVPTNRPHEIDNVLANVARQQRVETELVLLAHGIDLDATEVQAQGRDLGLSQVTVLPVPADRTLGAVLNQGVDVASGAYVAKMDDDNYYGAQFLGDLVDAFASTSAGITGKWAHYVWLRSTGAVVLRFERYENTYHRLVQGGSIVATREVAQDIRFSDIPRAVDSDFLNRAMAAGVRTWSGDRYNFISIRGTDRHSHTWQLDDLAFLTGSGRVVTYGDPRELVTL